MRRGLTAIAITALALSGCGPAEEEPEQPAPTSPEPAPDDPDDPDGEPEDTDPADDVATMPLAECEAPAYTVGYPEDWHTNDADGLLGPCEIFHPDPIDEPEQPRDRDLHHAVSMYIDDIEFDQRHEGDGLDEVVEERDTTVDGQRARVREVEGSGEAMLPEGERRYAYTVDLDGEVLTAVTHTIGETDYERDKRILDRMMTEELRLSDDTEAASGSGDVDDPEMVAGPSTTGESVQENEGTLLVVTDLRLGAHDGFDRVVWEIAGEDAPGWRIVYDDDPRAQGSGMEVDVDGDAVLHVSLTSFAYPFDAPTEPRDGPERVAIDASTAITEVLDHSIYEGHHDFYVGLDQERPYRVDLLTDPYRLVIDVETT